MNGLQPFGDAHERTEARRQKVEVALLRVQREEAVGRELGGADLPEDALSSDGFQ